jgi:hypothetical protein
MNKIEQMIERFIDKISSDEAFYIVMIFAVGGLLIQILRSII